LSQRDLLAVPELFQRWGWTRVRETGPGQQEGRIPARQAVGVELGQSAVPVP